MATTYASLPRLVSGPNGEQGIYINNPNLQYPAFLPIAAGENPATALQSYLNTYKGSKLASGYEGGGTTAPAPTPSYQPSSYLGAGQTISEGTGGAGTGPGGGWSGGIGGAGGLQPEQIALAQMAQIDPATEALRQQLAKSYATPLAQAGAPTAQQFQSYLDLYGQIDPTGLAGRQALGTALTGDVALGSQLDPITQREVEQATRLAQGARGNVYGTPQLTEEAMTTGQAGLALQAQRRGALQSYLQSGQTTGDVALNLYNQQMAQLRNQQAGALGYLGSGQTPYQAGSSYYQQAMQNAANAAQGGPVYNPQSLGQGMTGTAQQAPSYGLDIGAQSQNFMQGMNYGQMIGAQPQGGGAGSYIGAGANVLSSALNAYAKK